LYIRNPLRHRTGAKLSSAYVVSPLNTLWIRTEADRSSTRILLPEESTTRLR
jgi:hypothetical protein